MDDILEAVPEDKTILTYCTGGIRCRKTNAYIKQRKGFKNVVSLKHGIIGYQRWARSTEAESAFQGSNFIFNRSRFPRKDDGDTDVPEQ